MSHTRIVRASSAGDLSKAQQNTRTLQPRVLNPNSFSQANDNSLIYKIRSVWCRGLAISCQTKRAWRKPIKILQQCDRLLITFATNSSSWTFAHLCSFCIAPRPNMMGRGPLRSSYRGNYTVLFGAKNEPHTSYSYVALESPMTNP